MVRRVPPSPGSDLKRVDDHVVKPHEYKVFPETTDDVPAN